MAIKRSKTNINDRTAVNSKADITVAIVRQNQVIDHVIEEIGKALQMCASNSQKYDGQRELLARSKMEMRVLKSSMSMLAQSKLKLWMIDEDALEK